MPSDETSATTSPGAEPAPTPDEPVVVDLEGSAAEAASDDAASSDAPAPDVPALDRRLEALLIGTDRPLSENRLVELLSEDGPVDAATVRETVEALNAAYAETGRAFTIERLAGGWQILTCPDLGPQMARLHRDRQHGRLSQAALETLAIIAYRQPILRAEIEAVRGVSCGEVLRGLLERRLVKIAGRAEELGRPMLYGTTREFLKVFGLAGLDDLPEVEGLADRGRAGRRPAVVPADDDAAADEADEAGGDITPDGDDGPGDAEPRRADATGSAADETA